MTKIIQEKIQQLTEEHVTIKEQYKNIGERNDAIKLNIQHQYVVLKEEKEMADRLIKQKEIELEELEKQEGEIKSNYLKMIEKIKDHTDAVLLGQQKAEEGIKEVRAEIKQERRKYEGFLVRDHEKLGYARDQLQTRRLVQLSYENELKRVQERLLVSQQREEEKAATLEREKAEQKKLEEVKEQKRLKKKQAQKKSLSRTRVNASKNPYAKVESRVYQSI